MSGGGLHRGDRRGLDRVRLAHLGVGQHLAHLGVVRDLDVAGDVDLVDAAFHRSCDLVVRVVRPAVQNQRQLRLLLDLLQQLEFELGLHRRRVDAMTGADGHCQAVEAGGLH